MCSVTIFGDFLTTYCSPWTPKTPPIIFDPRYPYLTLIAGRFLLLLPRNMAGSCRSCCVPNCGKTRADDIILHAFPNPEKEPERFNLWLNAVGSSISKLDTQFILRNRYICHAHFEEKFLTWSRRLAFGAVPTLNLPGPEVARLVMRDITNVVPVPSTSAINMEHPVASTSSDVIPTENLVLAHDVNMSVIESSKVNQKGPTFINDKMALVQMLKKANKKNANYATRLKKALNLSENITFQNILKKYTTVAALFFNLQLREIKKKKMGRRFTEQEKIMALSIYKQGPKCYRMLSNIFVLPSPHTLSRLIAKLNLRAGINEKLFNVIGNKVRKLKADDKLCILMFDEIAISPHFEYNNQKDIISGFKTDGSSRHNQLADHALVFMVRGVLRNYKQPVAYTFTCGSVKKEELIELITSIIKKLHSVGLRVVATVCDQGASNVSCINKLINDTKEKYIRENRILKRDIFEVDGEEVIPLYDPPHLLKGVRNNLLTKDLKCNIDGVSKVAKWEHILKLHEANPSYKGIKMIKNLSEDHIMPEKCKMKVKFAAQVFSEKVASTMGFLAEKNLLPMECQETADTLLFFDGLFDSLNGSQENSKRRSGKALLRAVTPSSRHNDVWAKSKKVLSSMRFIKNNKEHTVPSIRNWLHTVNNVEYLRDVLFNKYKIKSFWMRHFNQDPLENFFGAIRSHGGRNVNPTPAGFEIAFASLLINNLTGTHSPGSNCEQDKCRAMFKSMRDLFKKTEISNTSLNLNLNYMQDDIIEDFEVKISDPRKLAHLQYVTGYILRKTKSDVFRDCIACNDNFYNHNQDDDYLRAREYDKKKRYLAYPAKTLVGLFSAIQDILIFILRNHSNMANIKNYAKTILYIETNTHFMTCEIHKVKNIDYIFDLSCRFFLHNWCKDVNNILKGRQTHADADDLVQNLAKQYVLSRRKKK